jgi:hypothetical protein
MLAIVSSLPDPPDDPWPPHPTDARRTPIRTVARTRRNV